jgi:hypothetical protein
LSLSDFELANERGRQLRQPQYGPAFAQYRREPDEMAASSARKNSMASAMRSIGSVYPVFGPSALTALTFEHANRQTPSRVHHLVDELWLRPATAPLLFWGFLIIAAEIVTLICGTMSVSDNPVRRSGAKPMRPVKARGKRC